MKNLNLHGARIVLRERHFLDVIDLAVRFIAVHGRIYARLSLDILLPSMIATWLIGAGTTWVWGWLAAFLLSLAVSAPFTVLASRLVFADQVRLRDVLVAAVRCLPRLVVARAIQSVAVAVGMFFFFITAAWVQAALLFVPEVILLEQGKVFASMFRASRIAHAQVGNGVLAVLLMAAFAIAGPFFADITGRVLLEDLFEIRPPAALTISGGGALSLIGFWASVPLLTTIRFLFYIDLRTRTEGWDIQTRFATLAARSYPQDDGVSV